MFSATLSADTDPGTIVSVLSPEIGRGLPRTATDISADGDTVTIRVFAKDCSAMRAALNSYLGWIRITENIKQMSDKNE